MRAMAKKHEDRGKGKKTEVITECNLDGDYISPILSIRDINIENVKSLVSHSRYTQYLIILTIIAFLLRFYNLGFNSLWLDEASTLSMSKESFETIWITTLSGDFHPPLFHWVEHIMLVFGQSEVILRFIPALLGSLTIPLFYFIGKEFRDRNVGLICAALLTVSYFGIFYSQEAYSYSMVLFVFSLVLIFYFRALRTDETSQWLLFGLFSALAVWTHYYVLIGLFVIYLHIIFTIREKLKNNIYDGKKILVALSAMTILILPLIFVVLERYQTLTASPPTYGVLGPILIQETFIRFSGGYSPLSWPIAIIYLILMFAGLASLYLEDRNKCLFSAMFLVLPLVISVIISSRMTMNPRYLIYLLPVYFALIAMSYRIFLRFIPNRKLLYAIIILIFVINVPLLFGYYTSFTKEDWRGFSQDVQNVTNDGDFIVVVPGYITQPFSYYYDNSTDRTIQILAYTGGDLDKIYQQKGNRSIYYIVTGDITAANPNGDALAWLDEKSRLETEHTGIYLLSSRLFGITISLFFRQKDSEIFTIFSHEAGVKHRTPVFQIPGRFESRF
jgi:4-amino-4-deoxy-L-arabinose transferase-like glycosyltransferase